MRKERFGDVDLGIEGEIQAGEIYELKEFFEESTLPFFVDVIDFNKVSDKFKKKCF